MNQCLKLIPQAAEKKKKKKNAVTCMLHTSQTPVTLGMLVHVI